MGCSAATWAGCNQRGSEGVRDFAGNLFARLHVGWPLLILLPVAALAGLRALEDWQGPAYTLTNELYVPAVMLATGHGFINPPVDEVPGLREFLHDTSGKAAFVPSGVLHEFSTATLDTYQRYHRYLVFAMGCVWRVLGVSWDSARFLAIAIYLASVAGVYGCLRLGMNAWWSLLGALLFAWSPLALDNLYNIRDFSKVPFLIAAIGIAGWLIRGPGRPQSYWIAAALLGLILGVGTGFRRDVMTAIPPVLLAILLTAPAGPWRRWSVRAGGAAVFSLMFLAVSSPVLFAFYERGSAVYHDILMGMAANLDPELALRHADYQRIPIKHDFYVNVAANAHARAARPGEGVDYDNLFGNPPLSRTRMYLQHWVTTYPADMALRGVAALLAISRGISPGNHVWPGPLTSHLSFAGPWYALAALYLAARTLGIGRASLAAFVLAYFCAITCLQFEARHALHLGMLPIAGMLLTWRWLMRAALNARASGSRPPAGERPRAALGFAAAVLAAPLLVWVIALPWQLHQVRALESRLGKATLHSIPVQVVAHENWIWRLPADAIAPAIPDPTEDITFARPNYLMIEVAAGAGPVPVALRFDASSGFEDYSMILSIDTGAHAQEEPLRYYFNAPECVGDLLFARFVGVGLPPAQAGLFGGLYRVDFEGRFDSPPNALLNGGEMRRRIQTLAPGFQPQGPPMSAVDEFEPLPPPQGAVAATRFAIWRPRPAPSTQ